MSRNLRVSKPMGYGTLTRRFPRYGHRSGGNCEQKSAARKNDDDPTSSHVIEPIDPTTRGQRATDVQPDPTVTTG